MTAITAAWRSRGRLSSPSPVTGHLTFHRSRIDASQALFRAPREQRDVRDFAKIFGDEPNWFVRRHPIAVVKPRQVYRARIAPERSLEPQIEINIEVTQRQFPQSAINRLAITAAREIRFGNGPPMAAHFEDGYDMVGIAIGLEIKNQRRKSEHSKRSRCENSAVQARCRLIA